jgi:hypothetical protein
MKQTERRALLRLSALLEVPLPKMGKGAVGQHGYELDMRALLPLWQRTLRAVVAVDPDLDGAEIDLNLTAMEEWFAARERESWRNPTANPDPDWYRDRLRRQRA